MKTAFLNAVARNGWEHAHNKYTNENEPIEFSWEIDLNGEPVRYKFSYVVGDSVENCNIVLEELNSTNFLADEVYEQEFNYFRCHDNNIGQGHFSTAMKKDEKLEGWLFD